MESIPQAQSGSTSSCCPGSHGSLTHVTYFCSASGKQPDGPCVQWVTHALECAAGLVSVVGQFCAHIPIRTIARTACPPGPAADPPRADHRQHHQPAPERLERPRTRRPPARQTPEYAYPARRMGRPRLLHRIGSGTYQIKTPPADTPSTIPRHPQLRGFGPRSCARRRSWRRPPGGGKSSAATLPLPPSTAPGSSPPCGTRSPETPGCRRSPPGRICLMTILPPSPWLVHFFPVV